MSAEELQDLVGDFRKSLAELARKGCVAALDAPCAPVVAEDVEVVAADELQSAEMTVEAELVTFGCEGAPLLFVGESQGDAASFEPAALELLGKMIGAMGWSVGSVCIAMLSESSLATAATLRQQIHRMAPKVVVTLGQRATDLVLEGTDRLSDVRGTWHVALEAAVMATFDPRRLLQEPIKKREAWADLQEVMKRLEALGIAPAT